MHPVYDIASKKKKKVMPLPSRPLEKSNILTILFNLEMVLVVFLGLEKGEMLYKGTASCPC